MSWLYLAGEYVYHYIHPRSHTTLGRGDGLAPVFGQAFGTHHYKTLGRVKTWEGSAAMFVCGFFGCIGMHALVFWGWPSSSLILTHISILACVGTVVEALSPAEVDNIAVPVAVFLTAQWLL